MEWGGDVSDFWVTNRGFLKMFNEVLELFKIEGDFSSVYTPLPLQQVFVNAHFLCKLINEMECDISYHYILPETDE